MSAGGSISEFNEEDNVYLQLCPDPIRFEPVSKVTNVFYDEANQQVYTVRSGGASGVVVKGRKESLNCTFRMEDKGPVLSIKFSPDQKILAVQRSSHSVEFMNFFSGTENLQEYSQTCKSKNATILGFIWISGNEILFVTKVGIELFQVYPEKRCLKYLKGVSVYIDWFLHSVENNILVVSSPGGIIQPFQLKPGNIYKFQKLDIDQTTATPQRERLNERDMSIVSLYNQTAVLVLRHRPKSSTCSGAEIDVYPLNREKATSKSHVLKLDTSGCFAINVIDNLIIVHHQASKASMLFDVHLSGAYDGYATYHTAVVVPMPIKQFKLKLPTASTSVSEASEVPCELYSVNWVVFPPNVIIDAKLGCLWFLQLKLAPIQNLMPDKIRLVEFLLQRSNGKRQLLQLLQNTILSPTFPELDLVGGVLDKLNENYQSFLDVEMQNQMSLPVSGKTDVLVPKGSILVDQQDLYTNIFSNFPNCETVTDRYIVQKAFYQLHQFLQNYVVNDSKHLACLLLSLEGEYPAAYQLALDMLKRLSNANDLIVEVLINKQKIIPALRFVQSCERTDTISARKFLDAAMRHSDKSVFTRFINFLKKGI
ncbi:hypothetical protein Ocin01_09287 [Orchesella cincta]|uniref:Uncharacterized protein n=1 Tax=Orchesella cincta TaxID=48709 RepID=A0A1D2MX61_ORCCI|nr:hypothetical protein Ocin01_09287 [Orchesella cincta]